MVVFTESFRQDAINGTYIAAGIIFLLTLLAVFFKDKNEWVKFFLFGGIVLIVVLHTAYLAGSTIYLNKISETKGPVHYHADFAIWDCGKELDLKDPTGFSNRIGSPDIHEHNDKRMHIEGVLLYKKDASLQNFIKTIGGRFDKGELVVPLDSGEAVLRDGQGCAGGSGTLQVFVYTTRDGLYSQAKLQNPQDYILSPQSAVPPGDCIIFELDQDKEKTDKMCQSYKVAKQLGKIKEQNGN